MCIRDRIDGLKGEANPTAGARLNLSGALDSLRLTAADGKSAGVTVVSQGFGVGKLSLPTPQNPSISLDPYLSHLDVKLHEELFERLADFADEALLKDMHQVIDRVLLRRLNTVVWLMGDKKLHLDIKLDQLFLQNEDEELIRLKDLSLSVLDYDTKLPPAQAKQECQIVLRGLRVEIEQKFFERVIEAVNSKIPSILKDLHVELPGPKMIAGGNVKTGPLVTSFRVDLKFETENDLFGIYFDRFYIPGTNVKLPGMVRNALLSMIRSKVEGKLDGLVEVSNDSLRINPWSKVPVDVITHVSEFAIEDGKIVVVFTEPDDRTVPEQADAHASAVERAPQPGDLEVVLGPGPAL